MSEDEIIPSTATATDPLLPKPSLSVPERAPSSSDATSTAATTVSNSNEEDANRNEEAAESESAPSAVLLGCCTLIVVLIGLGLVLFVSFFPLWAYLCIRRALSVSQWKGLLAASLLTVLHLRALWISSKYLWILRTMVLPIRRLLFPVVPFVARIESIREQETTQCYAVEGDQPDFRRSVRRHYRRMEKIYRRQGIHHHCVRAETSLVLRDVIPILWEHQKRSTESPLEDFIKRALVVAVVPDGILDLYYSDSSDEKQLVCLQFSILQGHVWHWFMYFCSDSASRAGIWWHGALLAIQRGHAIHGVDWVNAQIHQKESKLHAGYSAAYHYETEVLSQVYPWGWAKRIPDEAISVKLWEPEN